MTAALDNPGVINIEPMQQDEHLHVWLHMGVSDRLVLCFSGIGPTPSVAPPYEFARAATGNGQDTTLFFADPKRSWLNAPELIEKMLWWINELRARLNPRQVVSIGHSMGGFSAAVISGFTKVDVALCLSPQATVHPVLAHDDKRWTRWRSGIGEFRIRSVADHMVPGTRYTTVFGTHGREAPQRERFPMGPNIRFYHMPKTVHNTPMRMKKAGVLDEIVRFVFHGRDKKVGRILGRALNAHLVTKPTDGMLARAASDQIAWENAA